MYDDDGVDAAGNYRSRAYAERLLREFTETSDPKKPRPYQEEAIKTALRHLSPSGRPLVQIATGGGKTLVGNDVVAFWQSRQFVSNSVVLWVTKDWRLLHQAAQDLCRRHRYWGKISRIGGEDGPLHPLPEDGGAVRYTTLMTLENRIAKGALSGVGLVVWDECHWGENGSSGRAVRRAIDEHSLRVLRLTATPKPSPDGSVKVVFQKTFEDLVREDYLAKPVMHEPVRTGVAWTPNRLNEWSDFTTGSLKELAASRPRNELIVNHYLANARVYGRTIIFACTKEHATGLATMLNVRGVSARAIHSDNEDRENREYLDAFKRNRVDVVVNVEMLTHGVDVPSVQTVFLARPTLSDILYSQMVGRASRLDKSTGKRTFNIVEFTDNLDRFGADLRTAKVFFAGTGANVDGGAKVVTSTIAPGLNPASYPYAATGAPTWIPSDASVADPMRGLWFRKGQRFRVEFDLAHRTFSNLYMIRDAPTWWSAAQTICEHLRSRLPGRVASPTTSLVSTGEDSLWGAHYDSRVGWRVLSRELADEPGFAEVVAAAGALQAAAAQEGLGLDHRTDLRLHLSWSPSADLTHFIRLLRIFEGALATLVSPSQVTRFDGSAHDVGACNTRCQPISSVVSSYDLLSFNQALLRARISAPDARTATVNLQPLVVRTRDPYIEVRMHQGTLNAGQILLWCSLWQQILFASTGRPSVPDLPDVRRIEPSSNLLTLARCFLPCGKEPRGETFLERLRLRRAEVIREWARHPELSEWCRVAANWAPYN